MTQTFGAERNSAKPLEHTFGEGCKLWDQITTISPSWLPSWAVERLGANLTS